MDVADLRTLAPVEAASWWDSVLAIAEFDDGVVRRVRLYPIDLGAQLPLERRGTPRLADPTQAAAILARLAAISVKLNSTITITDGVGHVALDGRAQDRRP